MTKKVSFANVASFLDQHCKPEGKLKVIMGISMVSLEKFSKHYQNGEIFEAVCTEIQTLHQSLQPKRSLEFTVVLTGALHRHNIAIQNNSSVEAALEEALSKDEEWLEGHPKFKAGRNVNAALSRGHRATMESMLGQHNIKYEVITLNEWLLSNGQMTQAAQESLNKIQELYKDTNNVIFQEKVEHTAHEKVKREMLARFDHIYAHLEQHLEIAKQHTVPKHMQDTKYMEKHIKTVSSTIGQLQVSLKKIRAKEGMLHNENFLTKEEWEKLDQIEAFSQTSLPNQMRFENLKSFIPTLESLFKKVQNAFLESSRNYLLEEASTIFLFDQLGNQSFQNPKQASQSSCWMTYKDNMNPVFEYACQHFGIYLPYLPYKVIASKKHKSKQGLNRPAAIPFPLQIPDDATAAQVKTHTTSSASTILPDVSPSDLFLQNFNQLKPSQQEKIRGEILTTKALPDPVVQDLAKTLKAALKEEMQVMLQQLLLSGGIGRPAGWVHNPLVLMQTGSDIAPSSLEHNTTERAPGSSLQSSAVNPASSFFEEAQPPYELEGSTPEDRYQVSPSSSCSTTNA